MKKVLILLAIIALTACAAQQPVEEAEVDQQQLLDRVFSVGALYGVQAAGTIQKDIDDGKLEAGMPSKEVRIEIIKRAKTLYNASKKAREKK